MLKQVQIYTDGACSGNPGKGGYASILIYNGHEKVISGYEENTTNNIMELTAVIEALKALKEPCEVTIYSDSQYVVSGINEWLKGWIEKGWRGANKKPVANQELWQKYLVVSKIHKIQMIKVKGHSDNEYNNRCDKIAVSEYTGK